MPIARSVKKLPEKFQVDAAARLSSIAESRVSYPTSFKAGTPATEPTGSTFHQVSRGLTVALGVAPCCAEANGVLSPEVGRTGEQKGMEGCLRAGRSETGVGTPQRPLPADWLSPPQGPHSPLAAEGGRCHGTGRCLPQGTLESLSSGPLPVVCLSSLSDGTMSVHHDCPGGREECHEGQVRPAG